MTPHFDIVQNRGWKDDRLFRVWLSDDALKGVYLRSSGGWGQGVAAGSSALAEIPVVLFIWLLVIGIIALHVMIFSALRDGARQQLQKRRLETFDAQSDEFLEWDTRNFRLGKDEIVKVQIAEPKKSKRGAEPIQSVRVHLCCGKTQQWTFASPQLAHQFQEALLVANSSG